MKQYANRITDQAIILAMAKIHHIAKSATSVEDAPYRLDLITQISKMFLSPEDRNIDPNLGLEDFEYLIGGFSNYIQATLGPLADPVTELAKMEQVHGSIPQLKKHELAVLKDTSE